MQVAVDQVAGRRFAVRARGLELIVDDTLDQGGPGDGFRPTELLMGGLGACMMGTMITFARNQEIPIRGVHMELEDEEIPHPERIGRITIKMRVTADVTERQIQSLGRVAQACKIHNTLKHGPDFEFAFEVAK